MKSTTYGQKLTLWWLPFFFSFALVRCFGVFTVKGTARPGSRPLDGQALPPLIFFLGIYCSCICSVVWRSGLKLWRLFVTRSEAERFCTARQTHSSGTLSFSGVFLFEFSLFFSPLLLRWRQTHRAHTRCGLHCGAGSKSSNQNRQVWAERKQQRPRDRRWKREASLYYCIILIWPPNSSGEYPQRKYSATTKSEGKAGVDMRKWRDPPGPAASKEKQVLMATVSTRSH